MSYPMPSLEALERIPSTEFATRIDEILDRINSENRALLIDHHGRELLLVPASWAEQNSPIS